MLTRPQPQSVSLIPGRHSTEMSDDDLVGLISASMTSCSPMSTPNEAPPPRAASCDKTDGAATDHLLLRHSASVPLRATRPDGGTGAVRVPCRAGDVRARLTSCWRAQEHLPTNRPGSTQGQIMLPLTVCFRRRSRLQTSPKRCCWQDRARHPQM